MDDRAFFDLLLELWKSTTTAEGSYWQPEKSDGDWHIDAVDRDGNKSVVAVGMSEADADFITGIHGALPDLVRRLHAALDEAEKADARCDEAQHLIAELSRG